VGKGTGLGLATVYGIVMQTGGHIQVDSKPGHGTTFSIYLPRAQEAPSPPKEAAPAEMNTIPAGTATILLVEDSDIVRKLIRDVLEINGYTVLEAGSPEDAIVEHGILNAGIHFIQKPFSPASMAQNILEVLNS
jgi:two-component system, cell cycle sensor histidine kinase and response regulator CckA